MISTFHPSLLFCDSNMWNDEEYRDAFIYNLIDHIEFINKSAMKIAWSNDFYCQFWNNSPWINDSFYEPKLVQYIFPKMDNLWEYFDQPPKNECEMNLKTGGNISSVERSWLVLVHRLLHQKEKTFTVIGFDFKDDINKIVFFCDCSPLNYSDESLVISKPSEWFLKINYMDMCPKSIDGWDAYFKLVLEMCCKQEFNSKSFETPLDNVSFSKDFKVDFLSLQDKGNKKRIIKSITKLLTLNHKEAGSDGGLQEELLVNGEFRIRVSRGSRIHYLEREGKKTILKYIPASKHDSVL